MLPLLLFAPVASAAYSYYSLDNLPHTSESGQTGYNDCGSTDSQSSMCQTAHVNSVTDFCLWAPPTPGGTIGDTEEIEVAWCTASGHGARVMPQGTIKSAHFLTTPHYTQVTGTGDFTKINIQAGDDGGELDPHGATGNGNPIGSLVFNNGEQIHEWTSFISDTEFCFRICHDASDAWLWCQHIYDLQGTSFSRPDRNPVQMGEPHVEYTLTDQSRTLHSFIHIGCAWNEPGEYGSGFDTCDGDSTEYPPGIYSVDGQLSTYQQSQGAAPTAHAAGKSSNCQAVATVGGQAAAVTAASSTSAPVASSASSSAAAASASSASSSVVSTTASSSWTTSVVSASSSSVVSSSASAASSSDASSSASSSSSVIASASTSNSTSSSLPVSTVTLTSTSSSSSSATSAASSALSPSVTAGLAANASSGAGRLFPVTAAAGTAAGASVLALAVGALALFA